MKSEGTGEMSSRASGRDKTEYGQEIKNKIHGRDWRSLQKNNGKKRGLAWVGESAVSPEEKHTRAHGPGEAA